MKKLLSVILALTMLCGTVAIAPFGAVTVDEADTAEVGAQSPEPAEDEGIAEVGVEADIADTGAPYTDGDYEYTFDNKDQATITKYSGTDADLAIPAVLGGNKTVVAIASSVFQGKTFIRSVTMPDTITDIGNNAFAGCFNIGSVHLSKALKNLGREAFRSAAISSIEIPKSLNWCGDDDYNTVNYEIENKNYPTRRGPFYLCENLKNVTFEAGATQVAEKLFAGAVGLEEITIPDTVTDIEYRAFSGCLRLKKVNFGNSVKTIGEGAFLYCYFLPEISLPDTVTDIGAYAFASCTKLSSVKLSLKLKNLGREAFRSAAISSIEIPKLLDWCGDEDYNTVNYEIENKNYPTRRGPFYLCEKLKEVTFEAGATQVAEKLFAGAVGLEEITIPDTVTDIEYRAFSGCLRLKKVNFGNSVKTIGEGAFLYCYFLPEISLPDTVTDIGAYAFASCTKLSSVKLSLKLKNLGREAFRSAAISSIEIPKSLDWCGDEDYNTVNYEIENKNYPTRRGPFYLCEKLKEVTFEAGATQVAEKLFAGAVGLEEITIPDTVTDIEYRAFSGCLRLKKVNFGNSVKTIGEGAFLYCYFLPEISLPDTVTDIGAYAFASCTKLSSVKLSLKLKNLGREAFRSAAISSIEIPKSLNWCGDEDYNTVNYEIENKNYPTRRGPFYLCEKLKEVTFEAGATQVAEKLFAGAVGLEEITIPDTVTDIEYRAFSGCLRLKKVYFGNSVKTIGEGAFLYCYFLPEISLPDTVTDIGAYAFASCTKLSSVKLSLKLKNLGREAFRSAAISSIEIPKSLDWCGDEDYNTVNYEIENKNYPTRRGPFYLCEKLKEVTFEAGATQVAEKLFAGAVGLEEITIPDTVTDIEYRAFSGCLRLKKVNFGNSVKTIGEGAFLYCYFLPEISLPDTVTDIGAYAFASCTKLSSVKLSLKLKNLGREAFRSAAISSIEIPKSLDWCGDEDYNTVNYEIENKNYPTRRGPFYLCEKLKEVTFEAGATQVAEKLFAGAVGLEEITIPDTVTDIEYRAFFGCTRLKKVIFGNSVKTIGEAAFMYCPFLPEIIVPDTVTSFSTYTFACCWSLKKAVLPKLLKEIPTHTFDACTKLEDVNVPDSVTVIRNNAFRNCASLDTIDLSKNLYTIEYEAFKGSGLVALDVPDRVDTIARNAFEDNSKLESVKLSASLRTLGTYAFHNCEKLNEVEFTDYSLTKIDTGTFMDDPALASIDLPKGLKTIGSKAFWNDTGLVAVTIPESVTSIADDAFSYTDIITIYGITGSEANRFADAKGIRFIDNHIYAEGIALDYEKFGDDEEFTIDVGEWFEPYFELYPLESNDCISLSASNTNVMIDGMLIKGRYNGDSVITATTTGGAECTFTMHVREVKEIQLTGMPDKTEYLTGEALDTTGLEVTVVYKNGDLEVTDDYKITGYDPENNAVQKLTVTYTALSGKNYTKTFDVEVKDAKGHPTGIKVAKLPDKVNYVKRQSLDTTGMKVVETFDSGAEVEISDYTLSGYNALKVGEQTITVKYEDFTDTFTIRVYATEDELPDRPTEATEATEPVTEATEPTEPAHVHNLVLVPEVPATYEADGVRAYYLCEGCGKKYWDGIGLIEVSFDTELIIPKLEPTEPTSPATEESEEPVYIGDANGDGEVDSVDATIIQRVCTMIKVPYSEEQLMCADVDGDGALTVVDATFIQRYSTRVKTPYPIGEIK